MEDEGHSEAAAPNLAGIAQRVAERSGVVHLTGLRGGVRAVVCARLLKRHGDGPALFVTANAKAADAFAADLRAAMGEPAEGGRVLGFPRHDNYLYERFSPQPFLVAQRMEVLYRWLASERPISP